MLFQIWVCVPNVLFPSENQADIITKCSCNSGVINLNIYKVQNMCLVQLCVNVWIHIFSNSGWFTANQCSYQVNILPLFSGSSFSRLFNKRLSALTSFFTGTRKIFCIICSIILFFILYFIRKWFNKLKNIFVLLSELKLLNHCKCLTPYTPKNTKKLTNFKDD